MADDTELDVHPPLSREHLSCPHATDAVLRERDPVPYVASEDVWLLMRYDDVQAALRNPEDFSNRFGRVLRSHDRLPPEAEEIVAQGWGQADTLFTVDPPEHRRFRSLVQKAFTARRVNRMEGYIREVANELVADVVARCRTDVVEHLSVPLPMTVIADQLGASRKDLPLFRRWSAAVVEELSRLQSPQDQVETSRAFLEFQQYFHARIVERRETPRDDILSDLVHATVEGEQSLTDREILSMLQQLLVAGNETTTTGITAALRVLAEDPDLQDHLRRTPDDVPNFVEEVLRLETPIHSMWRSCPHDVEVSGTTIPSGSLALLRFASANRDAGHFDRPDEVVLDREKPRDHLAFGNGIHYCLGAALARSEIRIAVEMLLDRTRHFRISDDQAGLEYPPHMLLRGLSELHLDFEP